jgi:hemerythrin
MTQPLLEWSGDFDLGESTMDATHRVFVELLNRVGAASDDELSAALDDFIVHTEAHFNQEERWMQAIAFPPLHCHQGEHNNVLEIVHEVRKRVANGEINLGAILARAIAEWFPQHAATMDAMLAASIRQAGYVP